MLVLMLYLEHPNQLVSSHQASPPTLHQPACEGLQSQRRGKVQRMGTSQSKEQGQSGVLGQMKTLLGPKKQPAARAPSKTSLGTAPPSPRRLADTLGHPRLRDEFLSFLQTRDKDAGLPPGQCGRAGCLQFVLDVEQLKDQATLDWLAWSRYFPTGSTSGLVLRDTGLWHKCAEVVRGRQVTEEGRRALERARQMCLRDLATWHMEFLAVRLTKKPSKLSSCCNVL